MLPMPVGAQLSQVVRTDSSLPEGPQSGSGHAYAPGELIAEKYRLVRLIAQGGMGSIWIAHNLALDVQVALKLIRLDVKADGADERLLTEARAAARLKHPSILRVFDFGRTRSGDPFIVMEHLQGETLGDVLDRDGRLDAVTTVQLMLPIADGLIAAHAKGIMHRDLKPDNFFLSDSDGRLQPKIVDFGIARFAQTEGVRDRRLTEAGTLLGSPDYMSPEQARGEEDIDHRADVWAFCVVLYECITGRVPFQEANYHALLRHIIESDVPSILEYAAGDAELWRILRRGLAKDRSDRYLTMRELGEDLAAWLLSHGFTEDACGQSLKVTWLDTSSSNPNLSRISITEGRLASGSVPTLAPPPPTVTPTPAPAPAKPAPSRTAVLAVVALLIAASGFTAVWFLTRPEPAAEAPQAAPQVFAATTPTPPPVLSAPAPVAAPSPQPAAEEAPQPTPAGSAPAAASKKATPAAAATSRPATTAPPASAKAPQPPAPKSPYAEDLGF